MSESNQKIEKGTLNNTNESIENKIHYEQIKKDPNIDRIFSNKEIATLFQNINPEISNQYGSQALLGLLADFDKKDINSNLVKQEIIILQQTNTSQELLSLKQEIFKEGASTIDTNTSTIDTNTSTIDTNTSIIDRDKKHTYKQINNLKNIYENLTEPKYKPNISSPKRQKFYQEKRNIGNIESILQENNIDPYLYFQIRYTAEQYRKEVAQDNVSGQAVSFINQFNTLNQSLNIDYQISIPTEKMQFADKPNNLSDVIASPTSVLAYPSVREYTNKQPNIIKKPTEKIDINPKLQEDIWKNIGSEKQEQIQETIKKNCIDNQLLTPTDFTYKSTIDIQSLLKSPDTIDDNTKENIQHIIDNILGSYTQDYLITQTNTQTKQLIITQAVAGLASYFDTDTSAKDNYARDFDLSTGDMTIENNILHISGQMHGQIVHFFYNLQTGELQANDYLYKVMKAESFLINDINQGRYTLPNALPTISDLQTTMKTVNYTDLMQKNISLSNYQNTIRQKSNSLKEKFSTQTYNKLYITRTNEKNLFIQETLDTINTASGGQSRLLQVAGRPITIDNTSSPVEITRSMHPNEYDLLMLLDRTSQVYRSPDQLRMIRNYIHRGDQAIHEPRIIHGNHNDPVINTLFNQEALLEDAENRNNPSKKSNFLLFLDLTSNPIHQLGGGTIDITLLEKIINRMENNEPLAILDDPKPASYQNDPRYFNEKYENLLEE